MKKVPTWIKKVIFASQVVYCGDARNDNLNKLIFGRFDYIEFENWCRETYNITVDGMPTTETGYYKALERCDKNTEPKNIQRLINEKGL